MHKQHTFVSRCSAMTATPTEITETWSPRQLTILYITKGTHTHTHKHTHARKRFPIQLYWFVCCGLLRPIYYELSLWCVSCSFLRMYVFGIGWNRVYICAFWLHGRDRFASFFVCMFRRLREYNTCAAMLQRYMWKFPAVVATRKRREN